MLLAQWLVGVACAYLALGLLFALPFALRACQRIDPAAGTGTWGFRALLVPGAAALWPLLLRRWLSGEREPPHERNAHRDAATDAGSGSGTSRRV